VGWLPTGPRPDRPGGFPPGRKLSDPGIVQADFALAAPQGPGPDHRTAPGSRGLRRGVGLSHQDDGSGLPPWPVRPL